MYYINFNILKQIRRLVASKQFRARSIKGGYKVLTRNKNTYLFNLLDQVGIFDFNESNSGGILCLHQIVAYIYHGYKAFCNGFTINKKSIQVHHIDSDPTNNAPGNLTYLSCQEHLMVTQATTITNDNIIVSNCDPCPFNRNGKPISNFYHRLSYLVSITINRTFKKLGVNIKISRSEIYMEIPNNYLIKRINWVPKFTEKIIVGLQSIIWKDSLGEQIYNFILQEN